MQLKQILNQKNNLNITITVEIDNGLYVFKLQQPYTALMCCVVGKGGGVNIWHMT